MEARLQRRVQQYGWDKASTMYDRRWLNQLRPAQDLVLELAELRPGESVLDVACGTGTVSRLAAARVSSRGRVVGADVSGAMVRRAAHIANDENLGNVSFARMDAEDLDFSAESFEAVVCSLGMMYVPDPTEGFRQQAAVLKPGGRVVSAVWGEFERCGWSEIFAIVASQVRSRVCPRFFELGTGTTQQECMSAAGFHDLETHRLRTVLAYSNADEAIEAAFVAGPVALAHSRFDDKTRETVYAQYLESIEQFALGSGYRIPAEFVVSRGSRR